MNTYTGPDGEPTPAPEGDPGERAWRLSQTGDPNRTGHPMTAASPQPGPTEADLSAIGDLTGLAAHLTRLGHTTQVITASPPYLTLDYPGINVPQQIHIAPPPGFPDEEDWFSWHDPSRSCGLAPFTLRTTPPPLAAERADRVMQMFIRVCQIIELGEFIASYDPARQGNPNGWAFPMNPTTPYLPALPARRRQLPASALPWAGGPGEGTHTPGTPVEGTGAPGETAAGDGDTAPTVQCDPVRGSPPPAPHPHHPPAP